MANIPQVLAIISQIEGARASENLEALTYAELSQGLAQGLAHDKDEQRLILYALAVRHPAPDRIERACSDLESLGIGGFDADSLVAMLEDPAFHEFERGFEEWIGVGDVLKKQNFDASDADWEALKRAHHRLCDLAIAARSIAAL